ncbi:MAG: FtsX-like permease family protein [Planctomycetaceae bacterium]|jgi:lipoprotein-releasing system permease protein|nr:FtsX-like permease family protein [Planctomycetaceae bacterium]
MYKLLLCWRYLLTRFIALASVISVMLGVATLIVVNAVMSGFQHEMEDRLHGIRGDITIDGGGIDGFEGYEELMETIRRVAGDKIQGMTPLVVIPAIMSYQWNGDDFPQEILLTGIDTKTVRDVGFTEFLQHPENRKSPSFDLREGGYDARNHLNPSDSAYRPDMERAAGWKIRREEATSQRRGGNRSGELTNRPTSPQPNAPPPADFFATGDPLNNATVKEFDKATEQYSGMFMGIQLAMHRRQKEKDPRSNKEVLTERMRIVPGQDVVVSFPQMNTPPSFGTANFTIVDMYDCRMSEYDSKLAFVPIEKLQELRLMVNPITKKRRVNQILVKAKQGVDLNALRDLIQSQPEFHPMFFQVATWRDQESTLLAAVAMETHMLNVLLFLIIAVAGFGILATFYMIVLEKMRDVGIMKSLGASSFGVMQIFLYYSLTLGLIGAAIGTICGLNIVWHINEVSQWLSYILGREVFDPTIYMFSQIPTLLEPLMVVKVVVGTLTIAVLSGVLPAIRAARLHPVRALRFE